MIAHVLQLGSSGGPAVHSSWVHMPPEPVLTELDAALEDVAVEFDDDAPVVDAEVDEPVVVAGPAPVVCVDGPVLVLIPPAEVTWAVPPAPPAVAAPSPPDP
jgi:hypothetical protein